MRKRRSDAKFQTPEDLQAAIDEYFQYCEELDKYPVAANLAYALGFKSRQSMYDYKKDGKFSDVMKTALLYIEGGYEDKLINGDGSPAGPMFALKNVYGGSWADKQDLNHTSADGSMSPDGLTPEQRMNRIQELMRKRDNVE